ncbi:MAG: hypothetical protein J6T10_00485 [Methanobrevibacter sp.]|nr:hypothetical protein [Methanobrevibacter sp.]
MWNVRVPYQNGEMINLDWILKRVTELQNRVDFVKEEILDAAKAYADQEIDEKIAAYQATIDAQIQRLNGDMAALEVSTQNFINTVNARMALQDAKFAEYDDRLANVIYLANAYTDTAIAQNNDYIIEETTKAFGAIRVLNQFTGAYVTIQEMFDYLGNFHLTDAITISTLAQRGKTVTEIVALNASCSDIVINGYNIIV